MLLLTPQKGSETQNGRFPSKIALRLKKVCAAGSSSGVLNLQVMEFDCNRFHTRL